MTMNVKRVITTDDQNIQEFNALNADLRAEKTALQQSRAATEAARLALPTQVQAITAPAIQAAQSAANLAAQRAGVVGSVPNDAALAGRAAGDYRIGTEIVSWNGAAITSRTGVLASGSDVQALQLPSLAVAQAAAPVADTYSVGGADGGLFDAAPAGPVDNVRSYMFGAARVIRRPAPGDPVDLIWFGLGGVSSASSQSQLDDAAEYMAEHGGTYILRPGSKPRGHLRLYQPQKYLILVGEGASIEGLDPDKPVVAVEEGWRGGIIRGLRVSHLDIGPTPPVTDDPGMVRRTEGGHGFLIGWSAGWDLENVFANEVASMGVLAMYLDRFSIRANVEVSMGDGVHIAYGSKRGKLWVNTRSTGDDGVIPSLSPLLWPAGAITRYLPDGTAIGTGGTACPPCSDISLESYTIIGSASRGMLLGGGERISVGSGTVTLTRESGILVAEDTSAVPGGTHPNVDTSIGAAVITNAGRYGTSVGPRHGLWITANSGYVQVADGLVSARNTGHGILAESPARIGVASVYDNDGYGLMVNGPITVDAGVVAERNGRGVVAQDHATINLTGAVRNNRSYGLWAGAGSAIRAKGVSLENNVTAPTDENAQATTAVSGAIDMVGGSIRGDRAFGAVANTGCSVRLLGVDGTDAGTVEGKIAAAAAGGVAQVVGCLGQVDSNALILPEVRYRPYSVAYTYTLSAGGSAHPNGDTGRELWDGVLPTTTDYTDPAWVGFGTNGSAPLSITMNIPVEAGTKLLLTHARVYALHNTGVGIYQPGTLTLRALVDGAWQTVGSAAPADPSGLTAGWLDVAVTQTVQATALQFVMAQTSSTREFIFVGEVELYGRSVVSAS
ncbi:hypothetical protein [Deinococcus kurensis]|uniref:hypothetical protein n=1 Tax=Deinococcus kurensis TaxID=2662757 RepID=UPI0012D2F149|nr:hypothetical protein [Deinococcus kurensis]